MKRPHNAAGDVKTESQSQPAIMHAIHKLDGGAVPIPVLFPFFYADVHLTFIFCSFSFTFKKMEAVLLIRDLFRARACFQEGKCICVDIIIDETRPTFNTVYSKIKKLPDKPASGKKPIETELIINIFGSVLHLSVRERQARRSKFK